MTETNTDPKPCPGWHYIARRAADIERQLQEQ